MKVHTEITGGAAHVTVRCREMVMCDADLTLRGAFNELTQAGVRRIFLDLSRVRTIDGACLQELLSWGRRLADQGGELALVNPGLNDVTSVVTLLRDLRSFPDREEALSAAPPPVRRMRLLPKGRLKILDRIFGKTTILSVTA